MNEEWDSGKTSLQTILGPATPVFRASSSICVDGPSKRNELQHPTVRCAKRICDFEGIWRGEVSGHFWKMTSFDVVFLDKMAISGIILGIDLVRLNLIVG